MNTRVALAALLLLLAAPAAAPAGSVGGQYRYWNFSDGNDLRDVLVYAAPGPFHVQLEVWDFAGPETEDQFRPEIGIHLRDRRRSTYTLQWRHERDQERYWLAVDQVLDDRFVARAEASPIVARDSTSWVYAVGLDGYWSSYSFAGVTLIRDPRDEGLWIVPMRARFATERNDWLQLTFAPASERSVGWAIDGKYRWLRLGVERNNRYDFTRVDNTIVTVGFEVPLSLD